MSRKFMEDNSEVDFILQGEYEYTLRDLAAALRDRARISDLASIEGLIYRDNDGAVIVNRRNAAHRHTDLYRD